MMRLLTAVALGAVGFPRASSIKTFTHDVLQSEAFAHDALQSEAASFDDFVVLYGRSYHPGTAEYTMRKSLFVERLAEVVRQNSRPASERLWTASINEFSDYTKGEVQGLYGYSHGVRGALAGHGSVASNSSFVELGEEARDLRTNETTSASMAALPEEVLWTHLLSAQPDRVKSQRCGNCWAVTTSSMLEAHAEIHFGLMKKFDENEITDCTDNPWQCGGTGGCGGAIVELALTNLQLNWMLDTAETRDLAEEERCPKNRKPIVSMHEHAPHEPGAGVRLTPEDSPARRFGFIAWERLASNRIEPVKRALVARGPLAVAVAAQWTDYHRGIYDGCKADASITHSVLLIGYGLDAKIRAEVGGTKFWQFQNSWGKHWGEEGKGRLLRRENEAEERFCGVDENPRLGNGCVKGPPRVEVCGSCGILFDVVVPHFEPREADARERLAKYLGV